MARKKKNTWWRLTVIIMLIVGIYYWHPLTNIIDYGAAHVAGFVLRYYQATVQQLRAVDCWMQTKHELVRECAKLQQERAALLQQLVTVRARQQYENEISELVHFRTQYEHLREGHIVHILLKHFGADEHYFLVQGGLNDGFALNMIALINNHLIGRVAEVYPAYSKVQLLTDKMMKVSACCAQAKAYGILTGLCKPTEIALNFVDHLQDVQTGTMVLSSGTGLLYPQGLCLGTIIQAIKKDVTYDIVVKPLVDFAQLTYIFLLPPPLISQQQPVTPQTHTVPEVTKSVPASVQPTQVLVQDKPAEEVGKPAAEAESKINI